MCERYGVKVARIDRPWGEVFSLEEIKNAIEAHKPSGGGKILDLFKINQKI